MQREQRARVEAWRDALRPVLRGGKGQKNLAVVGHATMDVVTLGLWEIAGTPIELATQQEATTFILYYSADNKLVAYDAIK